MRECAQRSKTLPRPPSRERDGALMCGALTGCTDIRAHVRVRLRLQLILRSETRYFAKGAVIAESHERANGLMVITSGQVCEPPSCHQSFSVYVFRTYVKQIHTNTYWRYSYIFIYFFLRTYSYVFKYVL